MLDLSQIYWATLWATKFWKAESAILYRGLKQEDQEVKASLRNIAYFKTSHNFFFSKKNLKSDTYIGDQESWMVKWIRA